MREAIIELAGNFCVSAGAGAGKTSCLVETYLGLLAGTPERPALAPEAIVAITFTDKAAQEMRARVVRGVAQRAGQGASAVDWAALLPRVEWAPISTIHSFCAALLREFGALLGLDPEFTVLEAREFASLRQEVIEEVLRARLQQRDELLGRLLQGQSLRGRGSLAEMLASVQAGLATQGVGAGPAALATAQAHSQALAAAPGLLSQLDRVLALMAQGLASGQFGAKAGYLDKIKQISNIWIFANSSLKENPQDLALLERLAGLLGGQWGKAKDLKDQAQALVQELSGLAALPAAAALAGDLLALAQEVEDALEDELKRRAALSFDHLLLLALKLLRQRPEVLAELRGRYGALMVDEFQDVNPVQGQMVNLLAGQASLPGTEGQGGAEREPAGPVVLLVGDRKQSIYAFRGADVSVFSQAMEDFRQGAGRVAFLGQNFRSRPELIAFFNRLFPQVFGHTEHQEPAPEVYVRFSADDQQQAGRPEAGQADKAPGHPAVEVLDCRGLGDDRTSLAAWRQMEARVLAGHLGGLLASGQAAPGEVAMLFRRLTQVAVYERALSAAGLDYYTVGGRGFYQCQEVGDLLLALRTLLDPADALALAGFLRSPLVGLSDESLLALGFDQDGQARSLSQALAQGLDLPDWAAPEQQERWQGARAWLGRLAPLARRQTPAELLECLVEESDLIPVCLGTSGGEQKVANLRKLVESARDPRLAAGGVEDFARRLGELVAEPPEDAQAPLMGEEAPVIRLMSIHQAKGLEFPVVALADLAFKPRHGAPLLGPGGVMGLKGPDPQGGPARPTPLSLGLLARQRAVEEAEAARLFYVAATRARERLIFCLHGAPAKEQGYWGRWLAEYVLPDPQTSLVRASHENQAAETPPPAGHNPALDPAIAQPPALESPASDQARRLVGRCLHRQPTPPALVSESVSGLEDWLECPRRYWFTRRLMLDTAWLAPANGQGWSGLAQAAALGSAVHRLLEITDLARGPAGLADALALLDLEPDLAARSLALAAGWWDCGLPQILADLGPGRLSREQGFSLLLPPDQGYPALEVIGEFDLLAQPEQGPALLVDYKVSGEIKPHKYRAQMALYCLALWQGQGGQGPLPRALLCYLSEQGAQLRELDFSAAELAQWRGRLRQAAAGIANLPAGAGPLDLPAGEGCARQACALALSGLCPEA
ncbi:MAG: UvrD-helicase domain-containing protein [Pseudomonadota bacterium]